MEYVVLGGLNDLPEVAHSLGHLLAKRNVVRVHSSALARILRPPFHSFELTWTALLI